MKTTQISIPIHGNTLLGNLNIPTDAESLVIFSHGSGSSRFSKRNLYVANLLNQSKIATLLTDLLTTEEDEIYDNRFDIDLLTQRLIAVTNYVAQLPDLKNLPIGYFGASTGAASAIKAAAHLNDHIYAVVSRGGRVDLADTDLKFVKAPTMLIVGSLDGVVAELNKQAYNLLQCDKKLKILDGATHLFEEPGMLDQVADLATEWFKQHNSKSKTQSYALHR
jgi:putative phosphoribosyl transferase